MGPYFQHPLESLQKHYQGPLNVRGLHRGSLSVCACVHICVHVCLFSCPTGLGERSQGHSLKMGHINLDGHSIVF